MQNKDIHTIISDALGIDKKELIGNLDAILQSLQKAIEKNKEALLQANKIDQKNNNGFILDFNIIHNLFALVSKENVVYGQVTLSQKDDDKKLMYGKQIMDKGNVVIIYDGNPYVLIEMILRNLLAGNTMIFSNRGYMYGTNQLLIEITQSVLEKFSIERNLVQLYVSETFDELLANYANIDLVVCIGDRTLQNTILQKSKNEILTSGYENFDLYIEDASHLDFLNQILKTGLNIQLYINKDVHLDQANALIVEDIEEAIAQMNYNGHKYSAAIFTTSFTNASQFIREVKASKVMVNTSPTVERLLDIEQDDLYNEKIIIYPLSFKFDDHKDEVKISDE